MRIIVLFTGIPVALVAALHWHWVKDQIIHSFATEVIRRSWHKVAGLRDAVLSSIMARLLEPVPDPSAVLNWAMIVGGIAPLLCRAAFPKARPALVAGGAVALAVGVSREIERRSRQRQLRLAA